MPYYLDLRTRFSLQVVFIYSALLITEVVSIVWWRLEINYEAHKYNFFSSCTQKWTQINQRRVFIEKKIVLNDAIIYSINIYQFQGTCAKILLSFLVQH